MTCNVLFRGVLPDVSSVFLVYYTVHSSVVQGGWPWWPAWLDSYGHLWMGDMTCIMTCPVCGHLYVVLLSCFSGNPPSPPTTQRPVSCPDTFATRHNNFANYRAVMASSSSRDTRPRDR